MTNRRFNSVCTVLVASLVVGCGGSSGGGNGGSGGTGGAKLVLTTSKSVVDYGESVIVSWKGEGLDSMSNEQDQTNFPIGWKQFSGSFTDYPAAETPYQVVGFPLSGNGIIANSTVKVTKSSKSILVVGSETDPQRAQVVTALQTITDGAITVGASLPSSIASDVVVLLPSAAVGVADQQKVKAYLASGGSVAFVADAATKLANGHSSDIDSDISTISTILAGGNKCYLFIGSANVVAEDPGIPISATNFGDTMPSSLTVNPVTNAVVLSPDAAGGALAFAFKPSNGGKTAFLGILDLSETGVKRPTAGIFLAEVRWLADGT